MWRCRIKEQSLEEPFRGQGEVLEVRDQQLRAKPTSPVVLLSGQSELLKL